MTVFQVAPSRVKPRHAFFRDQPQAPLPRTSRFPYACLEWLHRCMLWWELVPECVVQWFGRQGFSTAVKDVIQEADCSQALRFRQQSGGSEIQIHHTVRQYSSLCLKRHSASTQNFAPNTVNGLVLPLTEGHMSNVKIWPKTCLFFFIYLFYFIYLFIYLLLLFIFFFLFFLFWGAPTVYRMPSMIL